MFLREYMGEFVIRGKGLLTERSNSRSIATAKDHVQTVLDRAEEYPRRENCSHTGPEAFGKFPENLNVSAEFGTERVMCLV